MVSSKGSAPTVCSPTLQPPLTPFPLPSLHTLFSYGLCLVPQLCHGLLPLGTQRPSNLKHMVFSHLVAKLAISHISSLNLHISFLQKLSMNPYSMLDPPEKESQTFLYFPVNDVNDNNYDHNNH